MLLKSQHLLRGTKNKKGGGLRINKWQRKIFMSEGAILGDYEFVMSTVNIAADRTCHSPASAEVNQVHRIAQLSLRSSSRS